MICRFSCHNHSNTSGQLPFLSVINSIALLYASFKHADREFIKEKRVKTYNDILIELPWDKLNMKRLGKKNSAIQIVHDSWLPHLREAPDYVQKIYDNSKLQKGLEAFINKNLDAYVYKRKR